MIVEVDSLSCARSRCASRIGGTPKWRLYSRLKWEASWHPTISAARAASSSSSSIRRRASSSCNRFWNCKGLSAVTALKWWCNPETLMPSSRAICALCLRVGHRTITSFGTGRPVSAARGGRHGCCVEWVWSSGSVLPPLRFVWSRAVSSGAPMGFPRAPGLVAVRVAGAACQRSYVGVPDARHTPSCRCHHVKAAGRSHEPPPNVRARRLQPSGHHRPDEISRLEAEEALAAGAMADGEAIRVDAAHLARAVSGAGEEQRAHSLHGQMLRRGGPHTGGIQPVRLGQPPARPVPLGAPAGAHFYRQLYRPQPAIERPAGGVDGGGIAQGPLGLRLHLWVPELLGSHGALVLVARLTGQREIACPVGAVACLGHDVLNLQRHARGVAVRATPPPLLQQVLAQLIAGQRPLLVLHAGDLRVDQGVRAKLHQLLPYPGQVGQAAEPATPGVHVGEPAFQRRRQPARRPAAVLEAAGGGTGGGVPGRGLCTPGRFWKRFSFACKRHWQHPRALFHPPAEGRRAGESPAGAYAFAPNGSAPLRERGLVRRGAYPALPPCKPPAS